MRKKIYSMLVLLCLTGTGAWAQSFALRDGDTWDDDTKTLYVNTDFEEDEEGAYEGYDEIEHVIIAYAVTRIGESTFSECLNLTSVTIPGRVTDWRLCFRRMREPDIGFHPQQRDDDWRWCLQLHWPDIGFHPRQRG